LTGSAVAPPWGELGGRLVGVVPVGDDEALALPLEILTQLDVPVGEFADPAHRGRHDDQLISGYTGQDG
jgi:hypothetical protein